MKILIQKIGCFESSQIANFLSSPAEFERWAMYNVHCTYVSFLLPLAF